MVISQKLVDGNVGLLIGSTTSFVPEASSWSVNSYALFEIEVVKPLLR